MGVTQVGGQLVLADVASPKRHRGASTAAGTLAVPEGFWSQIHSTVSAAVVTSLGPIQEAVSNLQVRACAVDDHVKALDDKFQHQAGQLQELDSRMAQHFSAVEEQILQLQKDCVSPRTTPPVSPTGAAAPQKSFDIVMGGWQAGEARDWIEDEVAKLLDRAGVRQHILEARPLGNKRPKCMKLCLLHQEGADLGARREVQTKVISALTACNWIPRGASKPVWVKPDRTLFERNVARAYAIFYQFLENKHLACGQE